MTAIYEATLSGCSDETPQTDELVIWIEAENKEQVRALLSPISALIDGDIVKTDYNPVGIVEGAVDLFVGESQAEDVIYVTAGKYSFIDGLYLSDYNLTEEFTANRIVELCSQYITESEVSE